MAVEGVVKEYDCFQLVVAVAVEEAVEDLYC